MSPARQILFNHLVCPKEHFRCNREAIEHLRKVLELRPLQHPDKALFFLATALAKEGHLEEAVNHYQQALRIEPEFAEAHEGLGQALN